MTIKIPVELAKLTVWQRNIVHKYETNRIIKAIDTWLVLKAETQSGVLQDWNKQKQHILSLCKVTESIFRSRLKLLQSIELLTFDRNDIRLCSWDKLAKQFDVDLTNTFTIQYDAHDKKRVTEWLIATEIKDNQERQAFKVMQKVNKNPEIRLCLVEAMVKAGAVRSKLTSNSYFVNWLLVLYRQDFAQASDIHELLILLRPDTNRGTRSIAAAWNAKSPQTVSYWKRRMQEAGIIDVSKLQIQSETRSRNNYCKVLWLKQAKQTLLCFCDSITLLMPWTICKDNTTNTNFSIEKLSA